MFQKGKFNYFVYSAAERVSDIIESYSSGFGYPDIVFEKGTLIQEFKKLKTTIKSFADGVSKDLCEKALKEALEYKDDSDFMEYC